MLRWVEGSNSCAKGSKMKGRRNEVSGNVLKREAGSYMSPIFNPVLMPVTSYLDSGCLMRIPILNFLFPQITVSDTAKRGAW